MMIYIILFICSIVSGLGIGGGSVFILITTTFGLLKQKEAMLYTLTMFIVVGIVSLIKNFKNNNKFDKKIFFKLIISVVIGSIIGSIINASISEENLKFYFTIAILLVSIYEIIVSILSFKKQKL